MENGSKSAVSVIIPNYRGEELLPHCLESVISQDTEVPFEVVVVDDGSDDGSIDLVAGRYPRVRLLANRRNRGPAAAKNLGAAASRGEYLAFLDNDVELQPGWMEAMIGRLGAGDESVGACASHLLLNSCGRMLNSTGGMVNLLGYAWDRGIFNPDSGSYSYKSRVMYACSAAMMVKKRVFEEVGGFDERLRYPYEDTDLGWRMNIYGYEVLYEPNAVARHLLSSTMGENWLRNLYLYERNRLRSVIKNMEPETLGWIRRELAFWLVHRTRAEMGNGLGPCRRILLPLWMARALGWNLLFLPGTLGRRAEIARHRRVKDAELIDAGVLSPQIGEPPISKDPRSQGHGSRTGAESRPLPRRINMAREKDGALGDGWYEREVDVRGTAFRWTGERATVRLRGGRKGRVIIRTVMAHPDEFSRVSLKVNGHPVSTFEVPNDYHLHRIPVPGEVGPGPWEVELRVLNPFLPRETLGIEDHRKLGVAVSAIEAG